MKLKSLCSWYRLWIGVIVLVPMLLCQVVIEIVPTRVWEDWSEYLYSYLVIDETVSTRTPSDIAIIEINHDTEALFGWPIDRKYYIKALDVLKKSGHPWILSYLRFYDIEGEEEQNESLAEAIKQYGRYVGSSLTVRRSEVEEMPFDQQEKLLPRAIISRKKVIPDPEDLDLDVVFDEGESYVEAQAGFGMGVRHGTLPVINCARLFQKVRGEGLAIPTTLAWIYSFFKNVDIATTSGERSFRTSAKPLVLSSKHCLSNPSLGTNRFFKDRKIEIMPFHSLLEAQKVDFKDKIVILAIARARSFQGPGAEPDVVGSGIVKEHYINARFLDDLLSGSFVRRENISDHQLVLYFPFAFALLMFFLSFLVSARWLTVAAFLIHFCMIGLSIVLLSVHQVYLIPLPIFVQTLLSAFGLLLLSAYLVYFGVRRIVSLRDRLRQRLVAPQTFEALRSEIFELFRGQFVASSGEMTTRFAAFYAAASSPENVAEYLSKVEEAPAEEGALPPEFELKSLKNFGFMGARTEARCLIATRLDDSSLGELELSLTFASYEKNLIDPILRVVQAEIGEQWQRVHLLARSKIDDYSALLSSTRTKILEQFLSQTLIDKFSDGRTMEENLRLVLTPHPSLAAVLQADIRGYSDLFADQDPVQIVKMLAQYYSRTVDEAQKFANVKLIGDCIFLFIEEHPDAPWSAADLALYLAAVLIRETQNENQRQAQKGQKPVAFGIAIHFGDVIVGNLSSASCIDYTVVGPNVNRTARMEEITKKPEVKELVGPNGVLVSKEAEEALRWFDGKLNLHDLNLKERGLSIRSFPHIEKISYLRAEEAVILANSGDDFKQVG